ncbi:MAG: hypothetical protein H6Q89_1605 [Myxococcaceae bacterium]|nr:hypothetical protein [Myxococcaceae bacterium]
MNNPLSSAALVLLLAATPGLAQPPSAGGDAGRPWASGVPAPRQEKALALFRDGNAALKESLFVKAAQLYREALQSWDHPAIHYNLALALVNLDQPLETHEHLLKALAYGPAPLDADKFDQALRYRALVEKQLAKVEVSCEQKGAIVKLDGVVLFTGPGRYEGLVRSGVHTLVASREGFLTNEQSLTLAGSSTQSYELKLLTAEDLTEYRRRWDNWIPWAVVAGGAAVAAGGAAMHLGARDAFKAYDTGVTGCSAGSSTGGCVPSVALAGQRQRGETLQALAVTSYVVGGAALTAGAVLVYLNRLQPYRATVAPVPTVSIAPMLGPATGATLFVTF